MTGANASRAKDVFLDALELAPDAREAFVAEQCAGDDALLARVRELLAAHTRATDVLPDRVVPPATPATAMASQAGTKVGSYRLIRPIGEGGFGTVWIAEQEGALRRRVAIKLLKHGPDSPEAVARFEAERRALARMEHPSIASVYEGGTSESGRPWFAMEFVDGEPLTRWCERRALGTLERLQLFLKVCRAVQHAHQKGIVHRDLKPTNVLVADVDGVATPKVIDFGIAKAVDESLTDRTLRTRTGSFLGTPAYMSPEQLSADGDVDTRADVYSLGVLLYELLCGVPPFDEETLRGASLFEIQRMIREVEPPRPSQRLTRERDARGRTPTTRLRDVRGELDWIVMRCLEKDRERRYESVAILANELERHLRGEPVLAGPPDVRYRLSKLVRRHRTALATGGAILLLVVAGAVIAAAQAVRATRAERIATEAERTARDAERTARDEADRARTELAKYERIALFLQDMFHSVDPEVARGRDLTLLREVLRRAQTRVAVESDPEVEAALRYTIGLAFFAMSDFESALPHLERAASLRETHNGPASPDTLDVLHDLGAMYLRIGRLRDAEPLLVRSIEGRAELLGRDDPATLKALEALGLLRKEEGDYVEAEALLREVEAGFVARLGADDLDTVRVSSNLAGVLDELGQVDEAEDRLRHALDVQLAELGPRHPRTLKAMNNLAELLARTDRREESVLLLERAVEVKREVLEPGDPSLLVSLNNLAANYAHLERDDEAERLYRSALEAAGARYGDRNPITLGLLHNYGTFLGDRDRWEEAEPLLQRAARGARALSGDAHPRALGSRAALARAIRELGRADEAAEAMAEVVELAPDAFPPGSAQPGSFWIDYGDCLRAAGREEDARVAYERGFELVDAAGDEDARLRAIEALVALHDDAGRADEAVAWSARAVD